MFENGTIGLVGKAIAAALAAGAATALSAMEDGKLDTGDWITILVALVVAFGAVFATPNVPETTRKYVKAIVGAVVAGAGVLTAAFLAGVPLLSVAILLKVALAVAGTFGVVYSISNAAESDPVDPVTHKVRPIRGKQSTLVARNSYGADPGPLHEG